MLSKARESRVSVTSGVALPAIGKARGEGREVGAYRAMGRGRRGLPPPPLTPPMSQVLTPPHGMPHTGTVRLHPGQSEGAQYLWSCHPERNNLSAMGSKTIPDILLHSLHGQQFLITCGKWTYCCDK